MSDKMASDGSNAVQDRVQRLLRATPLIDGHNDFPFLLRQQLHHRIYEHDFRDNLTCHTSINNMRKGMMGGQFWSIYVPNPEEARLVVPGDGDDGEATSNGYHPLQKYESKGSCGCEHIPNGSGKRSKDLGLNEPNVSLLYATSELLFQSILLARLLCSDLARACLYDQGELC